MLAIPQRKNLRHAVIILVGLTSTGCAIADSAPVDRSTPVHQRVAAMLASDRPFEARLSGSTSWTPCAPGGADSTSTSVACPLYQPNRGAVTQASDHVASTPVDSSSGSMDRTWSSAVIDLAALPSAQQLDAVIERMQAVVAQSPRNADARNDLAVAYLARHDFRHDGMSLFHALDNIEHAIETDSASAVIAFNRAIVLARLHLYEGERAAWEAVLARDASSGWATEARAHLARLAGARATNTSGTDTSTIVSDTRRDPQAAREWVINEAIGRWTAAIARRDHAGAAAVAARITAVSRAIEAQTGDSSLRHLASALDPGSPTLVSAMSQFADGARRYSHGDLAAAGARLDSASIRLRKAGASAAGDWADVMSMGVMISRSQFTAAESRGRTIEGCAARRGDIALRARAFWLLGLGEAREGKAATSVESYQTSGRLYGQLGERANEGSTLSQQGEVIFLLGRDDGALEMQYAALRAFSAYRKPKVRAGPLLALARQLSDVGLEHAGLAVLRDAATSALGSERATDRPEALIRLASAEFAVGSAVRGRADLARARGALKAVTDTIMNDRMTMELAVAEATMLAEVNVPLAIGRLDQVAGFFRQRRIAYDLPGPLTRAASLRLSQGDTVAAEANLAEAVTTIEAQAIRPGDAAGARAIAQARRQAYSELVAIHVARHDTLGAFLLSERARGNRITSVPQTDALSLAYTVRSHESFVWIVLAGHVRMVRRPVTESQLADMVANVERSTRGVDGGQKPATASRDLYDLLMAPAERELSSAHEVQVVADGFLGRLPFGALKRSDDTYLIEQLPVSYAASVQVAARVMRRSTDGLIVGNPAFDARLFPELQPLPAATAEARSIRQHYGGAAMLEDASATKRAFVKALKKAGMLHFAGHARLVDRAPLQSHLVLGRQQGDLTENVLSAAEIEALDLRNLGLVVLSACGTTQVTSRRNGSENGLSRAFLDAGAGAVVSSLWEVDDAATAVLMNDFHRQLAAHVLPAEALRAAQLAMLGSVKEHAAPRYWSAFRVETR